MTEQIKLAEIANKVGISAEVLRQNLYEELNSFQTAILLKGKETQLANELMKDGAGIFYYLIDRSEKTSVRPVILTDFVGETVNGIYDEAAKRGYKVLARFNHRDLATPDYFRTVLEKHPYAGVLVVIAQVPDVIAGVCAELNRPCLIMDYRAPAKTSIHTLNATNKQAVYALMGELLRLGHRRIAFITGNLEFASAQERFEGYKAALQDAGIPFDPALVGYGDWSKETAQQLTGQLLALPDRPTAFVCSNDVSALGAYRAIQQAGLLIPNDISVTGFDDIEMVANITPPLTTVRQSMKTLGSHAAGLLIDIMEDRIDGQHEHDYPLEVILRGSIGPVSLY